MRCKELTLFDVNGFAALGTGDDEVSLTAQEGRRLQDINNVGHLTHLLRRVHVRQNRNADLTANVIKNFEAFVNAGTSIAFRRRTVGFVKASLKNVVNPQFIAGLFHERGDFHHHFTTFDDTRTSNQKERISVAGFKPAKFHGWLLLSNSAVRPTFHCAA